MKLFFLTCMVLILLHTSVKVENRIVNIQFDYNKIINKIKRVVEKM